MKSLKINTQITTKDSISLKHYFTEVRKTPILTPEDEYEIAFSAFEGDDNAREKLIKHNLRFVISVAKQYETPKLKLEDLINEGNIGLIKAAKRFDPSRGFRFISYAVHWIRKEIISFVTENISTIRVPNNKSITNNKIKGKSQLLEQKLQYRPTNTDLLNELENEFSEDDINFFIFSNRNKISSLDKTIDGVSNGTTLSDFIEGTDTMSTSHYLDIEDEAENNKTILNSLQKKTERDVIRLLYGMDGKEALSLKTTGFVLGLSSERIRQIRDSALEKLKTTLA